MFIDIPYWSSIGVRHYLNVMHVEKNVSDSLIGRHINIQGKSKDGKSGRIDIVEIGIRQELVPK